MRYTFSGVANAAVDSESISLARFSAGIVTLLFFAFTALLVVILVRGIKRLRHD